jgi:hypothetical protein
MLLRKLRWKEVAAIAVLVGVSALLVKVSLKSNSAFAQFFSSPSSSSFDPTTNPDLSPSYDPVFDPVKLGTASQISSAKPLEPQAFSFSFQFFLGQQQSNFHAFDQGRLHQF